MPQGIIQVSPVGLQDHIDLTIDPALIDLGKLKEVLLLPERYAVEQVKTDKYHYSDGHGYVEIIVNSSDVPEVAEGEALPIVTPCYLSEPSEDFKTRTVSLDDILISAVSAIREEDKERKRIIEIKEVKDVSAIAHEKDETLRLAIALDARLKSLRNLDSSEADAVLSEVQGIVQWWVSDDGLLGG